MNEQYQKVMVVTPHPDDAEIACGGTVAKWVREGREVVYVVCSNGDKGSNDPSMTSETLAAIRRQEQEKAAAVLGVKEIVLLGHPDGTLEDTWEFRGEIVRQIRRYRPTLVLTCDPYRRYLQHRDHRIVGQVTLDAVYPYSRDHLFYPEHLAAGLEPHTLRDVYVWGAEEPDIFIDISDTIDLKVEALFCHTSQIRAASKELLAQWVCTRAAEQGKSQGMALAESFRHVQFWW